MPGKLDKKKVRAWLSGQREAQKVIERERAQYLQNLTHEEAWAIYLSLVESAPPCEAPTEPSFVTAAMRRTLARYYSRKRPTS